MRPTDRATSPRRPRLAHRLGWAVAAAALLAIAWTFAIGHWLPAFLKPRIEVAATRALGAPLTLQRLEIGAWTLEVRATDVRLGPAQAPWLDVAEITAGVSPASVVHLAPVLRRLTVRAPRVAIERLAPQRYNISPLLEALERPDTGGQTPPPRFELRSFELVDGVMQLHDRVGGRNHRIEGLRMRLGDLRSPATDGHDEVALSAAAEIDGSAVQLDGRSRMLRPDRRTTLELRCKQFDLARALADAVAWSGSTAPLTLQRGRLDTTLQLNLATPPAGMQIGITGRAEIDALQGRWPALGLDFGSSKITLDGLDLQPLERRLRVGGVAVDAPRVAADLARVLAQGGARSGAEVAPAPAASSSPTAASAPWHWQVERFTLGAGQVRLAHPAWPTGQQLSAVELSAQGLSGADAKAAPARFSVGMTDARGGQVHAEGLAELDAARLTFDASVERVQPAPWLEPWAAALPLRVLAGSASARAHVVVDSSALTVSAAQAELDALDLAPPLSAPSHAKPGQDRLRLAKGSASGIELSVPAAGALRASVGKIALDGLELDASRAADGRIDWLPARAKPARAAPHESASAAPIWHVGEARCSRCALRVTDRAVAPAAALALTAIDLNLRGIDADLRKPIDFNVAAEMGRSGRLAARGQLAPAPLGLRSHLDVAGIDLAVLQPYLDPYVNVTLRSALTSASGDLQLSGDARQPLAQARWRGRVTLDKLVALDRLNGAEFLRFRRASIGGADIDWRPTGTQADLGTVTLEGFYGRVILNADGQLNLRDILRRPGEARAVSLTTPSAAPAQDAPIRAEPSTPEPAPAPLPLRAGSSAATPLPLRWRAIHLADGELDFSDHFIRPNYSARLTGVAGDVSAFTSNDPQPARVEVAGKLDDSAPVSIRGTIAPLGTGSSADIRVQARGIDLTRLSAYATRYAGYGIDKGTLSADLHYRIDQGRLSADNKLVLDQLTFGSQKVEGPDVLKLPVLLAVSLLKDSNGVIDVELPISGSLDDPQFSVGGIVFRVIVNLIERAVTAPFRLLASAFGGAHLELSHVVFAPGSAAIDAAMKPALDTLAKALADRPGLRLEITGRADPATDTVALGHAYVERLLRQAKARATHEDAAEVTIGPAERRQWLEAAWRASESQSKPRAGGGSAGGSAAANPKALTDAELEALLLQSAPDASKRLGALADERADHVKAYLAIRVAPERLLITASKPDADGIKDKDGATRAEFKLQ